MSKPILGRGLSDLLGSHRTANPSIPAARRVDVGLRILIDGAGRADETERPAGRTETKEPAGTTDSTAVRLLAVVALISADAMLLGWAVKLALAHPHTLGFLPALGGALSVLVAALCGCAAILLRPFRI